MLFLGVRSKAKWTIWVVAEVRGDTCSHLKFSVAGQVTGHGLPGRQSSIIRVGGDMCCCQVTGLPGRQSSIIRVGGDMYCCQVTGLLGRRSSIIYEWAVTCVAVK